MYFLAPFILLNYKKRKIRFTVMRSNHFRAQHCPFAPNEKFFRKTINMISLYILTPFIVQNLLKILRAGQKLWACPIFRPKMPKNLLVHLAAFIHVYLHAKKSESDINPLTRYWWLKNNEIWLAESIFGHNFRTIIFPDAVFAEC